MMVWMLLRPEAGLPGIAPWRGLRTVQLGLGVGAITRYCYQVLGAHTTVVELNPGVLKVCRESFQLPPESDFLKILLEDAGKFVLDPARQETSNALCVDLYDQESAEPVLDTEEFYRGCRAVLRPGGIMTMNLFGRHASFDRTMARIAAAFGSEAVFSMQPTPGGNTVVGAVKEMSWPQASLLEARAANIEANFDLPASQWLKLMVR